MRNAAIIGVAAFYLLLATGSFVCIVHCTEGYLLGKVEIAHCHEGDGESDASEKGAHPEKGKGCHDKNCGCCDQHGNYVINENIIVNFNINISPVSKQLPHTDYAKLTIYYKTIPLFDDWPEVHSPPGLSGKAISIKFRSLLI